MTRRFVVTGTDTDIGKTVFCAAMMLGLENAHYWKPLQSGVTDGVDTRTVQTLTGLPAERFFPEAYIFSEPLSPHRAAEIDAVEIEMERLEVRNIPLCDGPLIIEGAGGLMVPITRKNLQINLYKKWNLPVILCARTGLGTINHTMLSLEALWAREIPVLGIAFVGESNPDNIRTISEFAKVKVLGRLPRLEILNRMSLKQAFAENFQAGDFF
ncbi:MAG: ATP-dependent dethiobiotin synthetase BioD [Alphaproteobacteria bacterium]|nr:ATP-dependent dethiobiotin synthetase BioD [Alphaproteobacteria bacterium]QQS57443.1 MAG: ATP-dependent dethiobiotin synthetase BioD [Alphaproteobacteria bacterium]